MTVVRTGRRRRCSRRWAVPGQSFASPNRGLAGSAGFQPAEGRQDGGAPSSGTAERLTQTIGKGVLFWRTERAIPRSGGEP